MKRYRVEYREHGDNEWHRQPRTTPVRADAERFAQDARDEGFEARIKTVKA